MADSDGPETRAVARLARRTASVAIRTAIRRIPPRGRGIRLAHAWTRRCPPDTSVYISRERGGARLHCDLRDELSKVIYYRGWVDLGLERWIRRWLEPDSLYVDVGAHIGYLAALAAEAVRPCGRVVAFEPSPETFERLSRAFEGPRFAHVETVQAAIAATDGYATFFTPSKGKWAHQAYRNSLHSMPNLVASGSVPTLSLDTYFASAHIRLLKIDVEGGEAAVLEGAGKLIRERRCDALVLELNPPALAAAGSTVDGLMDRLGRAGYLAHRAFVDGSLQPWTLVNVEDEFSDAIFLPL